MEAQQRAATGGSGDSINININSNCRTGTQVNFQVSSSEHGNYNYSFGTNGAEESATRGAHKRAAPEAHTNAEAQERANAEAKEWHTRSIAAAERIAAMAQKIAEAKEWHTRSIATAEMVAAMAQKMAEAKEWHTRSMAAEERVAAMAQKMAEALKKAADKEKAEAIEKEKAKAKEWHEWWFRCAEARAEEDQAAKQRAAANAAKFGKTTRTSKEVADKANAEAIKKEKAKAKGRHEWFRSAQARNRHAEAGAKEDLASKQRAAAKAQARADAEAQERAAAELREKADEEARARDKKVAADKANAEVIKRAEAERKERDAWKRAAEDKKRADEERARAERAAVGRAVEEARERAAAEAQQWAKTYGGNPSKKRKVSSSENAANGHSSNSGAAPSSGEFHDVKAENEKRRRERVAHDQRVKERAAKALTEKHQRDLQNQREQAERQKIAETLDIEIKLWAAGKDLRALLSTLQNVLWPECGWQPVSWTDMITDASVKKVYRKAALCIHPDKVQQKGANLRQKCIAEKVFNLITGGWNIFKV